MEDLRKNAGMVKLRENADIGRLLETTGIDQVEEIVQNSKLVDKLNYAIHEAAYGNVVPAEKSLAEVEEYAGETGNKLLQDILDSTRFVIYMRGTASELNLANSDARMHCRGSGMVYHLCQAHLYAAKAGISIIGKVKEMKEKECDHLYCGPISTELIDEGFGEGKARKNLRIIGTSYEPIVAFDNFDKETVVPGYYIGELKPSPEESRRIHVNPVPSDKQTREEISNILIGEGYRKPIKHW